MNPDRFFVVQFLFFVVWAAALLWMPFFRPQPVVVLPPGGWTGIVRSATTGQPVTSARLEVRAGDNATRTGEPLARTPVSLTGAFTVRQPAGAYTVHFEAPGYESEARSVQLTANGALTRDMFLMPKVPEGSLRVRLSWGLRPFDLDLHLTGPGQAGARYHVFFRHRFDRTADGKTVGLDRDDIDSYGPETITVPISAPGVLKVMVHNWSDRDVRAGPALANLGRSEAVVDVYSSSGHLGRWPVSPQGSGNLWHVLEISCPDLRITPVNQYVIEPHAFNVRER